MILISVSIIIIFLTRKVCFVDWSEHQEDKYYYSFSSNVVDQIDVNDSTSNDSYHDVLYDNTTTNMNVNGLSIHIDRSEEQCGYRAVKENVPRNFVAALSDPLWGGAARKELDTLLSTKAIVECNAELAKEAISSGQADLLILFPVYEEKMRDGELVRKVRLVCDGRTLYHHGITYSSTPRREELLTLLHIIATLNWEFVHVDESRAFLNSTKNEGVKRILSSEVVMISIKLSEHCMD
jgi:hypothetical protein